MVFSQDGACMASYGVPYVCLTLVVSELVMVVKYVFMPSTFPSRQSSILEANKRVQEGRCCNSGSAKAIDHC
jgi:hypothetical protein